MLAPYLTHNGINQEEYELLSDLWLRNCSLYSARQECITRGISDRKAIAVYDLLDKGIVEPTSKKYERK